MAGIKENKIKSDEEIILEIVELGNSELSNELCNRYNNKVFAKCYGMTKSKTVSEDLRQDIMLKVLEKIQQFKGKSSFSTWLYSITYNHCIEYLRIHKRIKFNDLEKYLNISQEFSEREIEDIMELKEERIQFLLEMLRPEDKAILLMKYVEGFDLKRIMIITKTPGESAIKMRLNRAKKRLLGLYNQFYPVFK